MNTVLHTYQRTFERGVIGAQMATLSLVLIMAAFLPLDVGQLMLAQRRAQVVADTAAFAAAVQLNEGQFRQDNTLALDVTRACQAARQAAADNGEGRVTITRCVPVGNTVQITARASARLTWFRIALGPALTLDAESQGVLLYGITEEGQ
jgi:Flp pilus assembly protein TadG